MTTYKGYEITKSGTDRFFIRLNGEWVTTVQGSLSCVQFCIDSHYEDMTPQPVDPYEGLDTEQTDNMNKDLHLSTDNYTLSGGYVKIEAEDQDTNVWYNVYFQYQDIAFSLDIDENELETYAMDDNATDGICSAAAFIYERYLTGTTSYHIDIQKQKVKGYRFFTQMGKDFTRDAKLFFDIIEVEAFKAKHNLKSYEQILG